MSNVVSPVVFEKISSPFPEKCGICLEEPMSRFAFPVAHAGLHAMCLKCISIWTKSKSTCPICRAPIDMERFQELLQKVKTLTDRMRIAFLTTLVGVINLIVARLFGFMAIIPITGTLVGLVKSSEIVAPQPELFRRKLVWMCSCIALGSLFTFQLNVNPLTVMEGFVIQELFERGRERLKWARANPIKASFVSAAGSLWLIARISGVAVAAFLLATYTPALISGIDRLVQYLLSEKKNWPILKRA